MYDNIIGNENIKEYFANLDSLKNGYVFIGPESIGKRSLALEIANDFGGNIARNIHLLESETTSIPVDDVRALCEDIQKPPYMNKYRVAIINDAYKLSDISQNTLLKILEQPPKNCVFFFIVNDQLQLLDTILSRCESFNFSKISQKDILSVLKDSSIDNSLSEFIAVLINGAIGRAFNLISDEDALEYYKVLNKAVKKLESSKNEKDVLSISELFSGNTDTINQKLFDASNWFMFKYMDDCSNMVLLKYCDVLNSTLTSIKEGANASLCVQLAIIRILKINEIASKRKT